MFLPMSQRTRQVLLVFAAIVVFTVAFEALSVDAARKRKSKKEADKPTPVAKSKAADPPAASGVPRQLSDDDAEQIPSLDNPSDKRELDCTSCLTVAKELSNAVGRVIREFHYDLQQVKTYHLLSEIDGLCEAEKGHYGLKKPNEAKRVLPEYFDEQDPEWSAKGGIVKGGWITTYWQRRCEEILAEQEDKIFLNFRLLVDDRVPKHLKKWDVCPRICAHRPQASEEEEEKRLNAQKKQQPKQKTKEEVAQEESSEREL